MFGLRLTKWGIEEELGYKPITTFWNDFEIAEQCGGKKAVLDTYNRAFKEWKDDVKYVTELVMVLNHRGFYWRGRNDELNKLYADLWEKTHNWCLDNLKGDDFSYYYNVTN